MTKVLSTIYDVRFTMYDFGCTILDVLFAIKYADVSPFGEVGGATGKEMESELKF